MSARSKILRVLCNLRVRLNVNSIAMKHYTHCTDMENYACLQWKVNLMNLEIA